MDGFGHPHVLTVTALDSLPLARSDKMLITLCGRCENTGMKFSKDRRTVGRNWGRAPVQIEARSHGGLLLPGQWPRKLKCYVLAPDGSRREDVIVDGKGDEWVDLDPKHKTMWYLLMREKK